MNPSNAASLRTLLRRIAFTVAASSLAACSSTVTELPADAGNDAPVSTDGPVTNDVPMTVDVPLIVDGPVTDGPPPDVDRCAARPVPTTSLCLGQDVDYACGLPPGFTAGDGGMFTMAECATLCGMTMGLPAYTCSLLAPEGGGPGARVHCNYACGVGRRAEGFHWNDTACDGLGAWFAHVSALEGAAVSAFDRMADELTAWGAPAQLIAEARRARADEVAHAERTARLAARFGATPVPFTVDAPERRTLEAAALENAVEGCVRETWGALVAWWQSTHARDAEIAAALAEIAADETRHAALSWQLAAWMRTRLDADALARVDAARAAALDGLRDEVEMALPASVVTLAGLPSRDDAAALLCALEASLA